MSNPIKVPPPETPQANAPDVESPAAKAAKKEIGERIAEATNETAKSNLDELKKTGILAYIKEYQDGAAFKKIDFTPESTAESLNTVKTALNLVPPLPENFKNVRDEYMRAWVLAYVTELKNLDPIFGSVGNTEISNANQKANDEVGTFENWLKANHNEKATELENLKKDEEAKAKKIEDDKTAAAAKDAAATKFETDNKSAKDAANKQLETLKTNYAGLDAMQAKIEEMSKAVTDAKNPTDLLAAQNAITAFDSEKILDKTQTLRTTIETFTTQIQTVKDKLKFPEFGDAKLATLKSALASVTTVEAIDPVQKECDALTAQVNSAQKFVEMVNANPIQFGDEQLEKMRTSLKDGSADTQTATALAGELKSGIDSQDKALDAQIDKENATLADQVALYANGMQDGTLKTLMQSVLGFMNQIAGFLAGSGIPGLSDWGKSLYTTQELIDSGDQTVILKRVAMKHMVKEFGLPVKVANAIANPETKMSDTIAALKNPDERKKFDANNAYGSQLDFLAAKLESIGTKNPQAKEQPTIAVLGAADAKFETFKAPEVVVTADGGATPTADAKPDTAAATPEATKPAASAAAPEKPADAAAAAQPSAAAQDKPTATKQPDAAPTAAAAPTGTPPDQGPPAPLKVAPSARTAGAAPTATPPAA